MSDSYTQPSGSESNKDFNLSPTAWLRLPVKQTNVTLKYKNVVSVRAVLYHVTGLTLHFYW